MPVCRISRPRNWAVAAACLSAILAGPALIAGPAQATPVGPTPVIGPGIHGGEYLTGLTEYLATGPQASTNGSVIGPDYTQGTLASEAVGREAVQLTAPGQYVKFTLTQPANAIDLDYALARSASGTLSVYINGAKVSQRLRLTSKYSYITTPEIAGSLPHHFFNDARMLLGRDLRPGDTVRLQVGPGDTAVPYTINLADFYEVARPLPRPAHSVSVISEGADPTGTANSATAFAAAIAEARARHETVWIPPGRYLVAPALHVKEATIEGAGAWYSQLLTDEFIHNPSTVRGPVNLRDFAILGSSIGRHDLSTKNAIDGSLGTGSVVRDLWIQNTNAGIWLRFGNTDVTIADNLILDTDADGINLDGTATGVVVKGNLIRNTGDDGLAIWSHPIADTHDTFTRNTVEQPNLANGIAEYGGADNTISGNVIADTNALGSGLTISNQQFTGTGFTPLAGTITVTRNTLIRTGAINPNWHRPMSAIQIDSYNYPITGVTINITHTTVLDSPYSVFELVSGNGDGFPIDGLNIEDAYIDHVGTVVFQGETTGSAYVSGVRAYNVGVAGTVQKQYPPGTPAFTFDLGPGNSGWSTTPALAYFPAPIPPVP